MAPGHAIKLILRHQASSKNLQLCLHGLDHRVMSSNCCLTRYHLSERMKFFPLTLFYDILFHAKLITDFTTIEPPQDEVPEHVLYCLGIAVRFNILQRK